ncbi:uncharacterized protein LOC142353748 isoform X2 [Convolutriloba macropyga]|uniref:uncharacterized protein LOC142353748 isoform X2 n=1 Tax=Convolutriloba macropyga TaxID=536237 RepID=UPI003F51CE49
MLDLLPFIFQDEWPEPANEKAKKLMSVLSLKKEDFDPRGDFKFPNSRGHIQIRGKMEYFQPNSDWVRVGLRCCDRNQPSSHLFFRRRYDNGNNDWLRMDRNKNEWAVGFHGSTQEGTQSVTQTRVFKAGQRQLYSNDIDTNKLSDNFGRPCGVGIYFSAEVEISERYSQFKIDGAKCVLQERKEGTSSVKCTIRQACRDQF